MSMQVAWFILVGTAVFYVLPKMVKDYCETKRAVAEWTYKTACKQVEAAQYHHRAAEADAKARQKLME